VTEIERLAELLRRLPPAPSAWVQAAQELPLARAGLDEIVARAEANAAFRAELVADLESAIDAAGVELDEPALELLRKRLSL